MTIYLYIYICIYTYIHSIYIYIIFPLCIEYVLIKFPALARWQAQVVNSETFTAGSVPKMLKRCRFRNWWKFCPDFFFTYHLLMKMRFFRCFWAFLLRFRCCGLFLWSVDKVWDRCNVDVAGDGYGHGFLEGRLGYGSNQSACTQAIPGWVRAPGGCHFMWPRFLKLSFLTHRKRAVEEENIGKCHLSKGELLVVILLQ